MAALIRNQDRFLDRRTLIVTGERAEESRARAGYATFEPDRVDARNGTRRCRHVGHWRPVHGLTEAAVWEMLRRLGIEKICGEKLRGAADDGLGALIPDWQLRLERIAFRDARRFVDRHHAHLPGPAGWRYGQGVWNGRPFILRAWLDSL